jgi:hypothetical protein
MLSWLQSQVDNLVPKSILHFFSKSDTSAGGNGSVVFPSNIKQDGIGAAFLSMSHGHNVSFVRINISCITLLG